MNPAINYLEKSSIWEKSGSLHLYFALQVNELSSMELSWQKLILTLNRFGKQLTILLVVLLISVVYPQRVKFQYEFQKGQRWNYETLLAPYDIPIKKSAEQIAQDRARLIASFIPYYKLDKTVEERQLEQFRENFHTWFLSVHGDSLGAELKTRYESMMAQGEGLLSRIYQNGVIEVDPQHQNKGPDFVVNVISGNTLRPTLLASLKDPDKAEKELYEVYDSLALSGVKLPTRGIFQGLLFPNIFYDVDHSQKMLDQALSEIVTTKGIVRKGEVIVTKNAVITDSIYEILVSFKEKFEQDYGPASVASWVYVGYLLLIVLVFVAFLMYVSAYRKEILNRWSYLISVLIWPVVFIYLTFLVEKTNTISVFLLPYTIVPIVMRHFFSYRLAFFVHVLVVLLCSLLTSVGYQFAFIQIVAGVVAVLAVTDARYWGRFFMSVLYITLTYVVGFFATELIKEGNLAQIDWPMFGWLAGNSVLVLLAFPLIPLMERSFGFVSSISLVELSDMEKPLLKMLSLKAAGTFQHSIQVGHLSEAAAKAIGADALLVKVGALYHDVGKALNPEFFVENQQLYNPHENMDCKESAAMIISHVTKGAELARKYRLPQKLIDFILTHHGTTRVEFFYKTYCNEHPDEEVDVADFTYPGPRPRTKEEGILMIADSVEATLRSVKEPSLEVIHEVVDKTIERKLADGQFNQCELSFKELEKIKEVLKQQLVSIYHPRIAYPT
ncbi:MAG: phosphohydrolase [Saprospirales bacterium]|nr:phosphohydrolase [Saprospirales bacterium]